MLLNVPFGALQVVSIAAAFVSMPLLAHRFLLMSETVGIKQTPHEIPRAPASNDSLHCGDRCGSEKGHP